MITKNDCMTILVKLEDQGLDINPYMKKLIISKEIPIEVLRFISQNRGIEVANFYEMLRKSYNNKKSPLYKNLIMNDTLTDDEVVVMLSSLLTQIGLYNSKLTNKSTFTQDVRAAEISKVISLYYEQANKELLWKLVSLIKADILVLEYIAGRRNLVA